MIHPGSARRTRTRETGAILPFLALGFIAIALFLVMAVDVGVGYMARGQLQNIADSAARAALQMRTNELLAPNVAANAALDIARKMTAASGAPGARVEFGDYDFATGTFQPNGMTHNPAVRVVASRADGAGGAGAIPGLMRGIDVTASSVVAFKCRDIVLAQDITASFSEEIGDAQRALRSFVDGIAGQSLPGDRLGLVTFNNDAKVQLPLTPVPQAQQQLDGIISRLTTCGDVSTLPNGQPDPTDPDLACQGTDTAKGIDAAIGVHQSAAENCGGATEKLIIVISDGTPCTVDKIGGGTQGGTRAQALAAADRADTAKISLASVFYNQPGDACATDLEGSNPPAAMAFSANLVRGLGRSFFTPNSKELEPLLLDVLKLFRVSVVG